MTVNLSDTAKTNDVILQPYDIVFIKQELGYSRQRTVLVEGMVLNPGRYSLRKSGDRISDLINRVGGFAGNADSSSAVIRRLSERSKAADDRDKIISKILNVKPDSIKSNDKEKSDAYKNNYDIISINLIKALNEPETSENMTLEDGDIITIDRNTNLVKVSGEVYFPTIIPYKKGETLKYYIQKSGSYTPSARRSGAMVIYADGRAKRASHFLFFKKYPVVESRSEIFVPQKSASNKAKMSTGEWALLVSALGIIANVIVNLKN